MLKPLFFLLALLLGLPVLMVGCLGQMPPPVTAFMLQSPTKPVAYQWVPAEQIAEVARKAVVASEDQKFWQHQGFDFEAMEKAYRDNQKRDRKHGASTISQQTAKNLFLWSGGGYLRKGIEAYLTVLIEALWSKQRILEVYLNIVELGPGIYGVEAAAQEYFRKPASELTANEAARLAAVLPNPKRWSAASPGPYVVSRTGWILRQMGYGARPKSVPDPEPAEPEGTESAADETDEPTPPAELQHPVDEPLDEAPDEAAGQAADEAESGAGTSAVDGDDGAGEAQAPGSEPEVVSPATPQPQPPQGPRGGGSVIDESAGEGQELEQSLIL